ncbi:hypothetical protein [Spirosoma pollinicola]|uniref:Uncharacterized protein n=1 Tax=Spirosoma pollinicola TaxID=2057025 RepID=A0A2K8YWZ0_9BACT|nr:hypothetical protein [Spirosoma pollinicola]AUD02147.1 hypothetical protein CWM47_10130 [Spirosoma pollinicola]
MLLVLWDVEAGCLAQPQSQSSCQLDTAWLVAAPLNDTPSVGQSVGIMDNLDVIHNSSSFCVSLLYILGIPKKIMGLGRLMRIGSFEQDCAKEPTNVYIISGVILCGLIHILMLADAASTTCAPTIQIEAYRVS